MATHLRDASIRPTALESRVILGMRTDATSYLDTIERVLTWASVRESRYVCVANVHMVMESHDREGFRGIVNGADLITPDGMPLVWALRLLGVRGATRVRGPSLTVALLARAAREGVPVGFYGGTPEAMSQLLQVCRQRFPQLRIVYALSPPFRHLTTDEESAIVHAINESGAAVLFVGLGCPKQERWMASHHGALKAVMLGVGAAFDFLGGSKPEAPEWMQRSGLEWLFRLATEPRRLWWRYAYHNPRFMLLFAGQLIGSVRK